MSNMPKIPKEAAIQLWNEGKSLREIAAEFPGASVMAAARAVERAIQSGLCKTREYVPSLPSSEGYDPLRIERLGELRIRVREESHRTGVPMSTIVRRAVRAYLDGGNVAPSA